jgi:outer membrane protein
MENGRVRLGLGALTFAVMAVVAGVTAPPESAFAGQAKVVAQSVAATPTPQSTNPTARPVGNPLNAGMPTPYPVRTLAPLTGTTSLPYPAYGTPVPGVNSGSPAPGVSAMIDLQQAEMIGFARSPALAIARADVGVEAAAVRLERAGLLPLFSGTATYNYSHEQGGTDFQSTTTGTSTTGTGAGTTNFSSSDISTGADFGVSLNQLIFDGGRIAAAVRAARDTETASADTYRRTLQTVAYNVATAYYTYLAAERTVQVDLEIVRENLVQLQLVEAQVRAGTAARSDIATVQLPLAQARLAVVRAQGAELSDEAAFANAMGLDANVKVQPIDDAPVFTGSSVSSIPIPSYDVALKRAIALRPDYDSSVQSVYAAQSSLRSASLGLFPTLSGSASASTDSTDGRTGDFRNAQGLGVSLSIPIFDQGVTAANVASDRALLDIAKANLQTTALTIQLNVKQSLASLVSALAALDQTQVEYSTAVTNLEATQAQYRAGVTTLPLLLNAQVQLTQALTDQVTAVYTLRQAEQTYLYQVGSNYATPAQASASSVHRLTSRSAHVRRTSTAVIGAPSSGGGGTGSSH